MISTKNTLQFIINTTLLREISKKRLLFYYSKYCYDGEESISNDLTIQTNLENLLDWDKNGIYGLGLYCSKFEKLKRKDIKDLIQLIKDYKVKIVKYGKYFSKKRQLENIKYVEESQKLKEEKKRESLLQAYLNNKNPSISSKGCYYEGKYYKSRGQCMAVEGLTKGELYRYLALSGQMDKDSPLAKKYLNGKFEIIQSGRSGFEANTS